MIEKLIVINLTYMYCMGLITAELCNNDAHHKNGTRGPRSLFRLCGHRCQSDEFQFFNLGGAEFNFCAHNQLY